MADLGAAIPGMGTPGFMDGAFRAATEALMNPPMPRFPSASVFGGSVGSWFYNFAVWLGLPLGPLGRPMINLLMRRHKVEWARKSSEERLMVMGIAAIGVGALLLTKSYPPGGLDR